MLHPGHVIKPIRDARCKMLLYVKGYSFVQSIDNLCSLNWKEFFMSGCEKDAKTELEIMWTNQHGTGPETNHIVESQIILQYMCQPFPQGKVKNIKDDFQLYTIRNGGNSEKQEFGTKKPEKDLIKKEIGLHEPKEYYHAYVRRDRNKGQI